MTRHNSRPEKRHRELGNEQNGEQELIALRAYRICDVCRLTGLGRTTIYAAIKSGDLIACKYGRSTIVLAEDLETFLQGLRRVREAPTSEKSVDGAAHG
jgi:excisionase family DNA binding protein